MVTKAITQWKQFWQNEYKYFEEIRFEKSFSYLVPFSIMLLHI